MNAEQKFNVTQEREWTILRVEGGGTQTTVSLTKDEATLLIADLIDIRHLPPVYAENERLKERVAELEAEAEWNKHSRV